MPVLSRPLSGVTLTAALFAVLASPGLLAQVTGGPAPTAPPAAATPAPMEFDVVSVKPNTSENGMMRVMTRPGIFSATGVTLKTLIQQAYNIREDLISSGPGWVGSSAWDIEGKISPADADALKAMTNEQRNAAQRQMMQHALVDRFKLQTHIETKTLPVYELVLAKSGSKLKEADPNNTYPTGIKGPDGIGRAGSIRIEPGKLMGQGLPISSLTNILSRNVERTVIDKTGLTGKYDLTLTWKPEDDHGGQENGAADANAPDLFTALQEQLGLKLVSTKGPVDTLVIDHVEKPAEN
jgi:uncharacterized protein (TIGR03435 family)